MPSLGILRVCVVEGCGRPGPKKSMCDMHYRRAQRGSDLEPRPRLPPVPQDGEEWRPVVGYEGLYEVSSHGRVRSLDRFRPHPTNERLTLVRGRVLKLKRRQRTGHLTVTLQNAGRSYPFVHGLVLAAFVGPRPEGMECCHNDGNPANNHVSNLRWDTHAANLADMVRHGTRVQGQQIRRAKLTPEEVREIRASHAAGATQAELARRFRVTPTAIWWVVKGKTWKHLQ